MKNQFIKFYDDTNPFERFNETKEFLFDNYADIEGWNSMDDILDETVYHEIDEINRLEWIELKFYLDDLFENGTFIIKGTCGRWNGPAECGRFVNSTDELLGFLKHLDNICFYEKNGHFYIEGYHHDGYDSYELKKLTKKGIEYADNNFYAHDKKLHENIMTCNLFSTLPYFSRLVGA